MNGISTRITGLTQEEVARRLAADGPNELPRAKPRAVWTLLWEVLREPMFRLLVAAGLVYLLLGDEGEALLLLFFILLSVFITVIQQLRTDRALEALRDLSSPRALVIREGEACRIAGRDLVRGDILVLAEGDRVPADASLLESQVLEVDESLLTGESVAVPKRVREAQSGAADENLHCVYAGTLVVAGRALAEVTATGVRCEMGRIGALLREMAPVQTPLALQIRQLVRVVAVLGLLLSACVVLIHGLSFGDWLEALLAGIALAMALLPEEFPVVLTVFLALGARRLAGDQVLTRRPDTIEALGAASVLCTDKTGTLTRNRMAVVELRTLERSDGWQAGEPLDEPWVSLARCALAASSAHTTDPMEQALQTLLPEDDARAPLKTYSLSAELLAMGHAWPADRGCLVTFKGAPETIAELCRLDQAQKDQLHAQLNAMAARGLRVLAAARAGLPEGSPPASLAALGTGADCNFMGLIGFADPLRESVPAALRECREAGIRVLMITGDYPATARAIGEQAGLPATAELLTGADIDRLSEDELASALARVSICARVSPRHKLRIVEALRRTGAVVGMTGDGVNDAPALRAAHIGIAMGGRGTDVAREASSLVLLDDDFSSIVTAVRLGRRIHDNLTKALAYIVAVHIPIAGLTLFPLLLGWPLLLGPLHIVFMELVVDPVCSIVFEAEPPERALMQRQPRDPRSPIFNRRLLAWSLSQGFATLVMLLALDTVLRALGTGEAEIRTVIFLGLVASNLVLLSVNRRFSAELTEIWLRSNPALWPVLSVLMVLLAAVIFTPALRVLFGFTLPAPAPLGLLALGSAGLLLCLELMKPLFRPRTRTAAPAV
jgi:Ca2+-transporting ATPase